MYLIDCMFKMHTFFDHLSPLACTFILQEYVIFLLSQTSLLSFFFLCIYSNATAIFDFVHQLVYSYWTRITDAFPLYNLSKDDWFFTLSFIAPQCDYSCLCAGIDWHKPCLCGCVFRFRNSQNQFCSLGNKTKSYYKLWTSFHFMDLLIITIFFRALTLVAVCFCCGSVHRCLCHNWVHQWFIGISTLLPNENLIQ